MAIQVCFELPDIPKPSQINLPAGMTLASMHSSINKIPSVCDNSLSILNAVQPALAPLKPFFDILDTVIALFNCFKAVPKALGSLNPKPIFDCIPEVIKKIEQLLKLIPQLSIPYTIISIIDNVLAMLQCLIDTMYNWISQTEILVGRLERAAKIEDSNLDAILDCAQGDIDKMQLNATEALGAIGSLVGMLNIFMSLIGGPEIPLGLGDQIADSPLDEILENIQSVIDVIQGIRDKVPIP